MSLVLKGGFDITELFQQAGGVGRAIVSPALWEAIMTGAPHPLWLRTFAPKVSRVADGKPYVDDNGKLAYVQLRARRVFRFDPGGHAEPISVKVVTGTDKGGRTVLVDIADEADLADVDTVIEGILQDLEAEGCVRRVGMRDGRIVWAAVKRS